MNRTEKALKYYFDGFNCAQSVIASFADVLEINEEVVLKIASGFGGGMGRMQQTCGAATGAFMVIGFLQGKYKQVDDQAKELTNNMIQEFSKKFVARHGQINCKALIDFDLNTEEGRLKAEKADVFNKKCTQYITDAVEILEEILLKSE